jgi:hypothetical protein
MSEIKMVPFMFVRPEKAERSAEPREGMSTPWGRADHVKELIPGAWFVGTPSHGGVKLSRERNAQMPPYMRQAGGWYEEDCHWAMPYLVFWPEFQTKETVNLETVAGTVKNWNPDEYERFTGETIQIGESYIRDRKAFEEQTADKWVAIANVGDWHKNVPPGFVGSTCTLGGKRGDVAHRYFLVPDADYRNDFTVGRAHGLVIDVKRHEEVEAF